MPTEQDASEFARSWWIPVLAGGISIVAGILAIVYPDVSLLVLALIAGINLIILSALMIGETLGDEESTDKTLRVALGILGVLAGIVVVRRPSETLLVLVLALGIWILLDGLVALLRGAFGPRGHRLLHVCVGLFQTALGIVILSVPHVSLRTLAVLVGLSFVVRGGLMVISGFVLRSAQRDQASRPVAQAKPAV